MLCQFLQIPSETNWMVCSKMLSLVYRTWVAHRMVGFVSPHLHHDRPYPVLLSVSFHHTFKVNVQLLFVLSCIPGKMGELCAKVYLNVCTWNVGTWNAAEKRQNFINNEYSKLFYVFDPYLLAIQAPLYWPLLWLKKIVNSLCLYS